MTIQDLFQSFLAGKQLPSIAANQARALLDMARSKLLSRGVRPPAPGGDIKSDLLAAHRLLTGGAQVYASADKGPLASLTERQVDDMLSEHKRTGKPLLEIFAAMHGGSATASARPAAKPAATRPAPAARPAPARPATPAPAPGTFAARMTAANASEIARAILDETEARRVASLRKTRAEFDRLTAREKGQFFKSGGKLTD